MPRHIAFLRAINLGKNRRFPMADVKACLAAAGFGEVETHLATGNVLVASPKRSRAAVEGQLEKVFAEATGFEVPTMVVSPAELVEIEEEATSIQVTAARRYVSFLKSAPVVEDRRQIDGWDAPGEGARVLAGRAVLWWLDHPTQAAKLSNARIERALGVATTRDLKVVTTLAGRWGRGG